MTFEDAVKYAVNFFDELEIPDQNTETSYDILSPYPDPPILIAKSIVMFGGWSALIERAEKEYEVFEAIKYLLVDHLDKQLILPKVAQDWLIRYLLDTQIAPKKKRGRHSTPDYKKLAIYQLSEDLERLGFKPTRGENSPKLTTCDIIAEAMVQRRDTPNDYGAVLKARAGGKALLLSLI